MKVLLIPVTYNSYADLHSYLRDVNVATANTDKVEVRVSIVDNSVQLEVQTFDEYKFIDVEMHHFNNLGYLRGAGAIINSEENIEQYDYVIISNVDLSMPEDFFVKFSNLNFQEEKVGWLANRIWTKAEKRDKNPKILRRYSKNKLQMIRLLYKYPILDWLYTNTMYRRKSGYKECFEQNIYAGHGSFIILTKEFFKNSSKIEYPVFLFGEEIFLAEICQRKNLKVRYIPDLVIYDNEHTSTGKMKRKFYYKCNLEAINYLLHTFYE